VESSKEIEQAFKTHTRENVDIDQYPDKIASHPSNHVVVLGDLHGNTLKLLHCLIREGMVKLAKEDYETIVSAYKKNQDLGSKLSDQKNLIKYKANLEKFKSCLSKCQLNNPCPGLRLIGDDLADRGYNDHWTILLFEKMFELKLNYEIIESNHGFEFLKQLIHGLDKDVIILYKDEKDENEEKNKFGESFYCLRRDMEHKLTDADTINSILKKCYLAKLKMLNYHILSDEQIIIYSHASIEKQHIKELALLFKIQYKDNTVQELAATIDDINKTFSNIILNKEKALQFINHLENNPRAFNALNNFINNRYNDIYENNKANFSNNTNRDKPPQPNLPFTVINVHGHVGEITLTPFVEQVMAYILSANYFQYLNIDSDVGKHKKFHKSPNGYVIFLSDEAPKLEQSLELIIFNKLQSSLTNYLASLQKTEGYPGAVEKLGILIDKISRLNEETAPPNHKMAQVFSLLEESLVNAKKSYDEENHSSHSSFYKPLSFIEKLTRVQNDETMYPMLILTALNTLYSEPGLSQPELSQGNTQKSDDIKNHQIAHSLINEINKLRQANPQTSHQEGREHSSTPKK
jgi:hypothetical protein